jgi:1-acyl-sn-glycerol-3-phosphate acyltransferase
MIKWLFSFVGKLVGWRYAGNFPVSVGNCIAIGAPHTSNWDFVATMFLIHHSKINAKFIIKHEWTKFPLGLIFNPMGAIGIDRSKIARGEAANTTDLIAGLFDDHDDLVIMISPEGTRSPKHKWKTGFFYIAEKANIPIVMAYADYGTMTVGFSQPLHLTDVKKDMKTITEFFRPMVGKNNDNFKLDKRFR